jgi:2-haloacid dehalogenase
VQRSLDASITTVVFDLGGVLVDWDPRRAFEGVLPADDIEPFLAEIDFHEWNRALDAGDPIEAAEADIDRRFPHRAGVISAYRRNFRSTLVGELPGTADIVRELADSGQRLLALTNWSAESFPHALATYPVLGLFDGIVVSGAERLVKPDPQIFRVLIARHDVEPTRSVFIDDSAANVASARRLGFHALQFTDARTLRRDLTALGLPLARRP